MSWLCDMNCCFRESFLLNLQANLTQKPFEESKVQRVIAFGGSSGSK